MKSSNVIRSFALVLAIAAGQFSLQVAHAHAALQQSTPAANAVVARQARSISCSTRH
jgi:methionine-rich copper-binding protein CopC